MKFYFPDSQDQIDPQFDFVTEKRSPHRVRQRDDLYAHEALGAAPYAGMLVSKAMVDGTGLNGSRYTMAQRHRLYRQGVRRFFRLDAVKGARLETMGDCGAFTYVKEPEPPFSVDEVIDFYEECGFDAGVSVDHVILAFKLEADHALPGMDSTPKEWRSRQRLTLELAAEFRRRHEARRCRFQPIGVAQGWSPGSYASAVQELQKIGYRRIGLGGMVPLKTHEILASLKAIDDIRTPGTALHLFGISRCEHVEEFARYGVASIDTTSPFRKAFKDDRNNYYAMDRTYSAIRVPQVDGNPKLKRRIQAGEINQREAIELERRCRQLLRAYDQNEADVEDVLDALRAYETLYDGKRDRGDVYREALIDRPWKTCPCQICKRIGIDVMLLRGTERNKSRGFHNVYVFNEQLKRVRTVAEAHNSTVSPLHEDRVGGVTS